MTWSSIFSLFHIRNTKSSQVIKSKLKKPEVSQGLPSYHEHAVVRTALCLQNKQGESQQITGGLDLGQKKWGKQKRKRTCIQVYSQTVCRLNVIFIKACTCRRSRLTICWQKDKSPSDLRMYFHSKNTHEEWMEW